MPLIVPDVRPDPPHPVGPILDRLGVVAPANAGPAVSAVVVLRLANGDTIVAPSPNAAWADVLAMLDLGHTIVEDQRPATKLGYPT